MWTFEIKQSICDTTKDVVETIFPEAAVVVTVDATVVVVTTMIEQLARTRKAVDYGDVSMLVYRIQLTT